ncbi:MAG: DUF2232 domain-containing protein [Mariprofundaceae bacterium]|nr:DUF2232 domain-containing protein [Mariprofundaceae bacterium]
MMNEPRALSPIARFLLTKHLACTALALIMLSAMVWLPILFSSIPFLALLFGFAAVILHMLTPALFALIFMGGGMRYTLQISGLVALGVTVFSGFDMLLGIMVALFYCVLPALAANNLMRIGGVSRSATQLLFAILVAVVVSLLLGAQSQDLSLQDFVSQLLAPMFEVMQSSTAQSGADQLDPKTLAQTQQLLSWTLPGLMAFSLWLVWWSNIVLARKIALRYGFYTGASESVLQLRFAKPIGYALMLSLILANIDAGSLQYLAASLALMLAGVLSVQGIAVAHMWLKSRELQIVITMMYVLLFIWFMIVIPFIILGLLDIWFDYRRNENPTLGG